MRRILAVGAVALLVAGGAPAAAKGPFAGVAEGDGVTWVASPQRGLLRVADGRVAGVVDVGAQPMAVAAAGGEAWTLGFGGDVARVAGERAEVRRALALDAADLAVGRRSLWVLGSRGLKPAESVLLRLDRRTLRVRGAFHLGRRAVARLAVGNGRVWLAFDPVSAREPMGLVAIGEEAGRLTMRRRLPGSPRALAAGRRGVWVLSSEVGGEGRLREVATNGAVRRSVPAPREPGEVAVAGGRVWVTSLCGGDCDLSRASVHAYDEATARAVAGPFRPSCDADWQGAFLSGIAPAGRGVALATGRPTGTGLDLVMLEAERGPVDCIPLAPET